LLLDAPVRNARYTLFDANGRMIIQSTMHDSAEHISCCNWAPGIYFIKVHNGGKTAFQKVAVY
ncbi:MAG: T9SS type A sorting domain-containing protein, partial [Saprospiraceae bacterium]|nr:T9SS type A sorting domain-containing protein [Saprospiraceae bacterium]